MDDTSCLPPVGCAAVKPAAMSHEMQFMDPSRAIKLDDGHYYLACAAGCQHACRATDRLAIPWYQSSYNNLTQFSLAGYLLNVSHSFGNMAGEAGAAHKTGALEWHNTSVANEFNACPDVFPVGGPNSSMFAVLSSLAPSMTNEWWIGELQAGTGHFSPTAFAPLAHGVLDYGGVFAAKTGADQTIEQRYSSRRVAFTSSEDIGPMASQPSLWEGCSGMLQLMPRELSLGGGSDGSAPWLRIAPVREAQQLRRKRFDGTSPLRIARVGPQVEMLVTCAQSLEWVRVAVLQSADRARAVTVSYTRGNATLAVDRRQAEQHIVGTGVQTAPHTARGETLELRMFVDGGLIETFVDEAVAITSMIKLASVTASAAAACEVEVTSNAGSCNVTMWQLSLDQWARP
eukprot:SAG31_NODE_3866_length_3801_cov_2.237979_2_plen_401_part_00